MTTGRVAKIPANLDAERDLLGALLTDAAALVALQGIAPEDFYREQHAQVFRSILAVHERGRPVELTSVALELERRDLLDAAGGRVQLAQLAEEAPTHLASALQAAEQVKHWSERRRLLEVARRLESRALDPVTEPAELRTRVVEFLQDGESRSGFDLWLEDGDAWADAQETEDSALIRGLLAARGLGMIIADGKTGKTWLAIAAAMAITHGRRFLGKFDALHQGRVLYIATEGSRKATRARALGIARGMGIAPEDAFRGWTFIWRRPVELDDPVFASWLRRRAKTYVLIVVDVLADSWGGDEDRAQFVKPMMRGLRAVANEGPTVLLLHHMNRPAEGRTKKLAHRVRGSTVFRDAADSLIYLEETETPHRIKVTAESRDDFPEPPFYVRLPDHYVDGSEPVTFDVEGPDDARNRRIQDEVLDVIASSPGLSRNQLAERVKLRRADVYAEVDSLLRAGLLLQQGYSLHLPPDATRSRSSGTPTEHPEQLAVDGVPGTTLSLRSREGSGEHLVAAVPEVAG